jgi:hypothetical protein
MGKTKIFLDRQARAQNFDFGTSSASGQGLVTIYKGTAAASTVVLDVKGSQSIAGDLNLTGNLNITGSINETSVTNLSVTDINITLNKGGNTASAANAGLLIEGNSAAVIAKLIWDGSKWVAGDGSTQYEIITSSGTQTLNDKTLNDVTFTGTVTGLDTSMVGENSSALYFTEARVLGTDLAGLSTSTSTTVTATDTILVAVGKLQAQNTAQDTAISGKVTANGAITGGTHTKITYDAKGLVTGGANATTTDISEGDNLYFTEARVLGTDLAGLDVESASNSAITSTDLLLAALAKLQKQLNSASSAYHRSVSVTGDQDGVNKVYTIGSSLAAGSEQVFYNGNLLNPGASNDYVLSGTTLTFQAAFDAPITDDVIRVYGQY